MRLRLSCGIVIVTLGLLISGWAQNSPTTSEIVVDANAPATPFPHFWEQMFGSGRAILSLRESYRRDLTEVKNVTEFKYVRFHNILHREQGVYDEDKQGNPVYNFSYVDQIYDGLLERGIRPFVEISFMPEKLAARQAVHPFWYRPIVAPPKDYGKWDDLIRHLAQHLIERYGEGEVSQWYFEVWNEPNIDFWQGEPKQSTYFELYEHTARALKSVNSKIRVGGPATAAADWVDAFLDFVSKRRVPIDFVSSHGYADDTVQNLFHNNIDVPMDQRVCRAIRKVHDQIDRSGLPGLPLLWTEWNVPSFGDLRARDTIYVGAALADDIRQCDGLVDMMSFWTFDDVFEEDGVVKDPFHGGFGLIAAGSINKPSYNAFALLHRLGHERIANNGDEILVTKGDNGDLVLALWNLVDPNQHGSDRNVHLDFRRVKPDSTVWIIRLDAQHGNTLAAYEAMGKPRYPTQEQIDALNRASRLGSPDVQSLKSGQLSITIPVDGLFLIEILR